VREVKVERSEAVLQMKSKYEGKKMVRFGTEEL
jgi:hypothetical protein